MMYDFRKRVKNGYDGNEHYTQYASTFFRPFFRPCMIVGNDCYEVKKIRLNKSLYTCSIDFCKIQLRNLQNDFSLEQTLKR